MVGIHRLQQHAAGLLPPARPPGDLGQQLESALRSPEVRPSQPGVGIDNADQGDIGDVVAFGDHLGTDEQIALAGAKSSQDRFVAAARLDRIPVQPGNPRFRKVRRQFGLGLFGTAAVEVQVSAPTGRAIAGNRLGAVAIVA